MIQGLCGIAVTHLHFVMDFNEMTLTCYHVDSEMIHMHIYMHYTHVL